MMRKWNKIIPAALALSLTAAPVTAPAAEFVPEPGHKYDTATMARLQDNVLEYDEIEMLIDEYNTSLKNVRETYQDNRDSYKNVTKLKDQIYEGSGALLDQANELDQLAGSFKDYVGMKGSPLSGDAYANMLYSSELLNQKADQMLLSADSLTEMTPEMLKLKAVDSTKAALVSGAQSAMIGYHQAMLQRESLEDTIGLLQTVYESTQTQSAIGMATQSDVLNAKQNLETAQAGLLSIDASLDKVRQTLCTMMGWKYSDSPEIQDIPAADLTRIDSMNPETDLAAAIDNNFTLRYNLLDYENKTDGSVEQQNLSRTIDNEKSEIASSLNNLYNDVLQKRNEYETASAAYDLEQTKMSSAEIKYSVGTIGRLEYRQQQNALKTKEVAKKNAELSLFQSMETYDWALKGNLTIS